MSRGKQLQEMEAGTKQSRTAVNANAKPADPMDTSVAFSYEDLGGPTPENYRPDDDSAKLKTPGTTLKQVKDAVNKNAKSAEDPKAMKEEEELDDEEFISEEEDEKALLAGEELSEEFQEKARTIFEAALRSKVSDIREALEEQYVERLAEEVSEIKSELCERVDAYLEYVSEEWFTENQLSIQKGLKEELSESFMTGLKGLFEEHYVTIPEDKYDVLESMVEKLDEMETKLNEQIEKNVSLNKRLAESVADGILDQVSEGLAATQKEKLASLAESVEFESDEEYREKLETLKEAYFPSRVVAPKAKPESLSEQVDSSPEQISGTMSAYLKMMSAISKS